MKVETAAYSSCFPFIAILISTKLWFIKFHSMDHHCSTTLELVEHDETIRAPERDWDATAYELDVSVLAPEVSKTLVRNKKFN